MADESLLQVEAEPAWYEELMRFKDQGRVSMTPAKGLLRSNLATGAAAELANPPALNWDEEKYLELQKDRGKNLDRFLRFDFNKMQPGETFTKANRGLLSPEAKKMKDVISAYKKNRMPEGMIAEKQAEIDQMAISPQVFYHGSPGFKGSGFDLNKAQSRDHGFYGKGIYLTKNPGLANQYSSPESDMFSIYDTNKNIKYKSPEVLPVYVNYKNPLKYIGSGGGNYRFDQEDRNKLADTVELLGNKPIFKKVANNFRNSSADTEDLMTLFEDATGIDQHILIQKAGYDASVIGKGREVIIYDPRRIKSMFNQGSYNPFTDDLNTNLGLGSNYASRA